MQDQKVSYAEDPYTLIENQQLRYNSFENYVRPLTARGHTPIQVDVSDLPRQTNELLNFHNERDEWNWKKATEPTSKFLAQVDPLAPDNPPPPPEYFARLRSREEAEFSQIIKDNGKKLGAPKQKESRTVVDHEKQIRALRKMRKRELKEIARQKKTPPPETVQCGWYEYQGGATYNDIRRYREYEKKAFKEVMEVQNRMGRRA